ncbi:MAG: hypothetical protein K1X92_13095 [Bacteroidia bacterium]|nr:hypothetical protein [Bacteroidia bacterium]
MSFSNFKEDYASMILPLIGAIIIGWMIVSSHQSNEKHEHIIRDSIIQSKIINWREDKSYMVIETRKYKIVIRPIPAYKTTPPLESILEPGDSINKLPKADTFYFYKPDGQEYMYFDDYSVGKYGIKRNGRYIYEVESQ